MPALPHLLRKAFRIFYLGISVKENGIGIPATIQNNLFSMNSQVKRKGTAGERSFGIGLSVCKQIMDAHNGRIRVESSEGSGSVFVLQLPLAVN